MSKKHFSCDKEVIGSDKNGYYCPHCHEDLTDKDVLPMTVFEQISQSPETLAEKLVYIIVCDEDTSIRGWTSAFTDVHETKEQALAATVAKLKEVVE